MRASTRPSSTDMSRALGVGGTSDHPKLVETIHRVDCNCAPAPEVRILESMQAQVAEARG